MWNWFLPGLAVSHGFCNAANLYHSVKCLPVWDFLRMYITLCFLFFSFCTHPQWHYPPQLPSPLLCDLETMDVRKVILGGYLGLYSAKKTVRMGQEDGDKEITRYETSVWQNWRLLESTCWIWTCFFTLSSP